MIDELMTVMEDTKEQMKSFMASYGGLPEGYDETVTSTFQMYEYTIPSIFILSIFMLAFILLTLNLGVAKRLGFEVPKFPPFREMKLPVITLILYGAILLYYALCRSKAGDKFIFDFRQRNYRFTILVSIARCFTYPLLCK